MKAAIQLLPPSFCSGLLFILISPSFCFFVVSSERRKYEIVMIIMSHFARNNTVGAEIRHGSRDPIQLITLDLASLFNVHGISPFANIPPSSDSSRPLFFFLPSLSSNSTVNIVYISSKRKISPSSLSTKNRNILILYMFGLKSIIIIQVRKTRVSVSERKLIFSAKSCDS